MARGNRRVTIKPKQAEPTLNRFEGVCLLLGLDPDNVRKGQQSLGTVDVDVAVVGRPLLSLVCKNAAHEIDLDQFEKPAAEELVAVLVGDFFLQCMMHFERQKIAVRTTLGARGPHTSEMMLRLVRASRALSPASAHTTTRTSPAN